MKSRRRLCRFFYLRFNVYQIKKAVLKNNLYGFHKYSKLILMWAHQGLNLGPPDYESGALTN